MMVMDTVFSYAEITGKEAVRISLEPKRSKENFRKTNHHPMAKDISLAATEMKSSP